MDTQLELYSKAIATYYGGKPIMSDEAFDALEQQLLANNVIKNKIRFESPNSIEVKHLLNNIMVPLVSLYAIHTKSMFGKATWDAMHAYWSGQNTDIANQTYKYGIMQKYDDNSCKIGIMQKYDGMSCEATYVDGMLTQVVTKGDGSIGYDVTSKFLKAGKVPMSLKLPTTCQIRFEAVIDKTVFQDTFVKLGYKNERNAASGIVKSKDFEYIEYIDPIAYIVTVLDNDIAMNIIEPNKWLHAHGWPTQYIAPMQIVETAEQFEQACNNLAKERQDLSHRIDGIVVRLIANTTNTYQPTCIAKNGCEYGDMIALKFDALSAVSKVTKIDWRQRINGELFPRVEFEPVELDGTTVKAASAFNFGFIRDNNIYPGSLVRIEKGGDIIPDIQECIQPGPKLPDECWRQQWCIKSEEAYVDGIHLMMPEEHSLSKRFVDGVLRLNVDGLGGTFAWRLHDAMLELKDSQKIVFEFQHENSPTMIDLFQLANLHGLNEFANLLCFDVSKVSDAKVVNGLHSRLNRIYLCHFIECLRMPGIGSKAAYQISAQLSGKVPNYAGLSQQPIDALIESGKLQHLIKTWPNSFVMFDNYEWNVAQQIEDATTNSIKVVKLVMTGSPKSEGFKTKSEFIDACNASSNNIKIEDAGSNVDACDIVVTNDKQHMSNKLKAALAKGKQILTYQECLSMIVDGHFANL